MFLSDISIKRPIMMSMFLLVFLLFGTLSYFGMSLDLFPAVDFPYVTVQTVYPGAGPKEVETQITKKIEDAVSSISKIDQLLSYSMENVSFVILKFDLDKDVDIANQEVKDKIDVILNEMPEDAELPLVQKLNITETPILDVVLTGDMEKTALFELADRKLKDRLAQVAGVAKVDLTGGQEREIRIEFDNRLVYQNDINLSQLSQILAAHNMDMPGGNFNQRTQEFTARLDGEFDQIETIKKLKVPTAFGMKRLMDIAEVFDSGQKITERTSYFNNVNKAGQSDIVLLSLTKSTEGNAVEIAETVRNILPDIETSLPAGCKLEIITDDSLFIKSSVDDTVSNILLGILLTALVLLFFLHDLRSTIIVALAMPTSILSAFLVMKLSGFTMNIMTLMGLSTAVGVLVTNAVVVLENIFRHKNMGHGRKEAAAKGTAEVVLAVVASAMTNIAVFLPVAMMSSMVGQFFQEFALTVTYATIFSLLISFTLTPMLASLILPEHDQKKHRIGEKLEGMFHSWERAYRKILVVILANKKRTFSVIALSLALFIASLPIGGLIGFEFFPNMDEGDIRIEVELPLGYNLDQTANRVQEIEERLRNYDQVQHMLTTLGSTTDMNVGVNMAVIQVKLIDAELRGASTEQLAGSFIADLSDIPNALIRVTASSSMDEGRAPLSFYLMGQDVDELENYKKQIVEKISTVPGLINLNTSSRSGKPELSLKPDRQKLADAGLTVYDLAMALRSAITGIVSTQYRDAGEEYDIRIKMTDESIDTPDKIRALAVVGPKETFTLGQLADIHYTAGISKVMHNDKYKTIEITGASSPDVPLGDVISEINIRTAEIDLPVGYRLSWGGQAEMMEETVTEMLTTFIIALLLTYMLLAAILESLTQPLMILGTVPLALIGVFSGMVITGKTMNVISMMAIVMLLGIVVNNAILLLDYTNELRRKGMSVSEALLEACPTKLKPILMSTIAIILGMLPMAMGLGEAGRELRQPMGIVSIGGLVASTLLSLFVIPALYQLTTKQGAGKVMAEPAAIINEQ